MGIIIPRQSQQGLVRTRNAELPDRARLMSTSEAPGAYDLPRLGEGMWLPVPAPALCPTSSQSVPLALCRARLLRCFSGGRNVAGAVGAASSSLHEGAWCSRFTGLVRETYARLWKAVRPSGSQCCTRISGDH